MRSVILDHQDILQQIVNSLSGVDPDGLCSIYEMITGEELIYIGDDQFEVMECDEELMDWEAQI